MNLIIGFIFVLACCLGGYVAMHGVLSVLWQPFEVVIILGSAIGALIIASPNGTLMKVTGAFGPILKGTAWSKKKHIELLTLLFVLFKFARTKGALALEKHVEKPEESELFKKFPGILNDHHLMDFICDTLRLITMGVNNVYQIEDHMDRELETHHQQQHLIAHSLSNMSDGLPALGIVAAVLGVIKTMGAIAEGPEVLGGKIAAALVGTFLGVFLSYGLIGPMAKNLENTYACDARAWLLVKVAIIAYMQGQAPIIAVEFARKTLFDDVRPSFAELEEATNNAPTV